MVKETSTDSQSQQQPAVSQSGRKGKKSGSVGGGIEKTTSVESGSGNGNGSVADNNPSSTILLDAANYR